MIEIRRPDDSELCGHIDERDGAWRSLTVFGAVLASHDTRDEADAHVRAHGLASLAERWHYRPDPSAEWEIVCIQEASVHSVRLALGYYSMPGVPTVEVTRHQLEAGATLTLDP